MGKTIPIIGMGIALPENFALTKPRHSFHNG